MPTKERVKVKERKTERQQEQGEKITHDHNELWFRPPYCQNIDNDWKCSKTKQNNSKYETKNHNPCNNVFCKCLLT